MLDILCFKSGMRHSYITYLKPFIICTCEWLQLCLSGVNMFSSALNIQDVKIRSMNNKNVCVAEEPASHCQGHLRQLLPNAGGM